MDVFFDTTVLVAASVATHPQHAQALPALQRVIGGKDRGFISTHSIAEVYAALTRVPVVPRIHPSVAARMINVNLLPHLETVSISKSDYVEALRTMDEGGWVGAKIYDALLLRCAEKTGVQRIYTFNLADFRALAPATLQQKICSP